MKTILIVLLRIYQLTLSPLIHLINGGPMCRYHPTCSRYAIEALQVHGVVKGSWLTLRRLLRCHPWGDSGDDPVPAKKEKSN